MPSFIFSSDPQAGVRARSHMLIFSLSCLLGLGCLAGFSEWLVRDQVDPQDTRLAHLTLLETAESIHIAFGDSHVARGFEAQQGFVNLAYPSENIRDMAQKFDIYFKDRDPGKILLQADPHLFAPYRIFAETKSTNREETLALFSARHKPRMLGYFEAFLRGGGQLKSRVIVTPSGSLLSPGDLSTVPLKRRTLEAAQRRHWHQIRPSGRLTASQEEYEALVTEIADRGATLCLVTFPVSRHYEEAVEDAGHREALQFFQRQADRVRARYIDARHWVTDLTYFRDVDHLNGAGAALFSPRLLQACFGEHTGT